MQILENIIFIKNGVLDNMKVIELVREYHLELFEKTYKDVYGGIHNLVNLKELAQLEVRDVSINLKNNKATICVLDIEKIDKNKGGE